MITKPDEYRYVDFASGTMPTNRINGSILPLRTIGNDDPHKQFEVDVREAIKGEDITFLYEAAARRVMTFNGAKVTNAHEYYEQYNYTVAPVSTLNPEKRISANQMNTVVDLVARTQHDTKYQYLPYELNLKSDLQFGYYGRVGRTEDQILEDLFDFHIAPKLAKKTTRNHINIGDTLRIGVMNDLFNDIKNSSRRVFWFSPHQMNTVPSVRLVDTFQIHSTPIAKNQPLAQISVGARNISPRLSGYSIYTYPRRKILDFNIGASSVRKIFAIMETYNFYTQDINVNDWYSCVFDATKYFEVVKSGDRCEIWLDHNRVLPMIEEFFNYVGWELPFDTSQMVGLYIGYSINTILLVELNEDVDTKWWDLTNDQ